MVPGYIAFNEQGCKSSRESFVLSQLEGSPEKKIEIMAADIR